MHHNFALKFRKFDIFVIVASIVIAAGFIVGIVIRNHSFSGEARYLNVYHDNVLIEKYHINMDELAEEKTIVLSKEDYPDLLADFTIELNPKKGVRVVDITCYDHTCENQGWVNMTGLPIVCIPNDVYIEITSGSSGNGDFVVGGVTYEKSVA